MSDVIAAAISALKQKLSGGFAGSVKVVIPGEGAIMLDATGIREGDDDADVTLTADADTFRGMLEGEVSPTSAYMTGRLRIDGDIGMAMQLGSALA